MEFPTIIHIKDARVENQENPHVQIVTDHMLLPIKGVRNTKSRRSDNMWSIIKSHMPQ